MISEKELRSAAKELQSVLIMDPPIDSKAKLAVLTEQVKEAIAEIKPGDEFSEETQAVIDELSGAGDEEEEVPAPKKKVAKKVAPVEEEEEEEEESLIDQVTAAPLKLSVMTAFVKENAELKSLVKKLPTFEKASVLKAAILELLTPEEEEEEEAPVKKMAAKVAGAKVKTAPIEEEEEEEEAPAKKKGTGKTPFKSTKDTLGTTRGIEVFKGMQEIKGSQTIEAIAAAADARFVKAGGATNVKQSKNLVKVFLQAAIEWGVVVEKGGKLSNP